MVFLFGIFIVLMVMLLLNLISSFIGSSSKRDKDDIYIVNEGKNDKPKINPNIGEVTDYEEIE